jgi:inorganic pyrophosphatase
MELSTQLIRKLQAVDPAMRDILLAFADEVEEKTKTITVGRSDFNELKAVVKRIAEAQERTERSLNELIKDHKSVKKQLGGLSMDVGYGIEDRMIPHLPAFVKKEFGVDLTRVDRRNVIYPTGKYDEVNLYGEGSRDGQDIFVIGEAKAQPGKKDFDDFTKKLGRLHDLLKGAIESFMVGYQYTPAVEVYAEERYPQIRRFRTFEITSYQAASPKTP